MWTRRYLSLLPRFFLIFVNWLPRISQRIVISSVCIRGCHSLDDLLVRGVEGVSKQAVKNVYLGCCSLLSLLEEEEKQSWFEKQLEWILRPHFVSVERLTCLSVLLKQHVNALSALQQEAVLQFIITTLPFIQQDEFSFSIVLT